MKCDQLGCAGGGAVAPPKVPSPSSTFSRRERQVFGGYLEGAILASGEAEPAGMQYEPLSFGELSRRQEKLDFLQESLS